MIFLFLYDYVIKDVNKIMIIGGDNCILKGGINFEYVIILLIFFFFMLLILLCFNVDLIYYCFLYCKYILINVL